MFAGSANMTGPTLDDMLCLHARSAAAGTPLLVDGQYSMPFESWLAAVSRAAADRPLQAKRTEALRTSKI
jgi:alanine-alpha-ketoisovalerate/valine-pyruvate aminotransferase